MRRIVARSPAKIEGAKPLSDGKVPTLSLRDFVLATVVQDKCWNADLDHASCWEAIEAAFDFDIAEGDEIDLTDDDYSKLVQCVAEMQFNPLLKRPAMRHIKSIHGATRMSAGEIEASPPKRSKTPAPAPPSANGAGEIEASPPKRGAAAPALPPANGARAVADA